MLFLDPRFNLLDSVKCWKNLKQQQETSKADNMQQHSRNSEEDDVVYRDKNSVTTSQGKRRS